MKTEYPPLILTFCLFQLINFFSTVSIDEHCYVVNGKLTLWSFKLAKPSLREKCPNTEFLWSVLSFITRVGGQYRYLRYLQDVIGWKLRQSGQYSPVLRAAIATPELFKYGSIKCKQEVELSYLENLFSF